MGRRKDAYRLAVAGGVLLLVSGATGSAALYLVILSLATALLPSVEAFASALALALTLAASLGGLTVLLGARLLRKGATLPGKLLVEIGAGAGALGLLLRMARAAFEGGSDGALGVILTLDGIGVALAVAATLRAK